MLHTTERFVATGIGVITGVVCTLLGTRWYLLWSIRKSLKTAPKVPMEMCEKNHMYPITDALVLDLPELQEPIHMCPFCFRENLMNSEQFKQ